MSVLSILLKQPAAVPSAPASTAPKLDCDVVEVGKHSRVVCKPAGPAFAGSAPTAPSAARFSDAARTIIEQYCKPGETCPAP